jgi:hypothetical protein
MVAIKGLYQKRGWWYFSRMRGGIRKTIALETREESDAIRIALELANGPDLAIGARWKEKSMRLLLSSLPETNSVDFRLRTRVSR